ncbi:hypothetical protein M419DRAFT_127265 [Trichoderma reesei RUT C-30]|jgi:hypothetical protein|uniref:Uncharacterized protein n=1 Tax=Hypocrea jecorina (strain ATCC 56765 / BCRC 32924 / NRRL 11460 / Rut C-30) TaxID=1344414 RepID=A0A024SM50_HYPJR|nr:hypothetical protein M419DRAFT_127265 [Trichoderma reesei RUT C-30]
MGNKCEDSRVFLVCVLTKEGLVSWQLFDGPGEYTTECLCVCVCVCVLCVYVHGFKSSSNQEDEKMLMMVLLEEEEEEDEELIQEKEIKKTQ